ncbi:MAG: alanine racemase [Gammaproteobacteria bacterium]|nr:alanine racemase [Gammaproteobacteria bacterium]
MRPTRAVIHLSAIAQNLSLIRQMAPSSKVMAVVKADAYGHGIVRVAECLGDADALAVACIEEAIELRNGGVTTPIILLEGIFEAEELALVSDMGLQMVVHNQHQVDMLLANPPKLPVTVWLKFDSNMNRLGFDRAQFQQVYQALSHCSWVESVKLMTHFACADDIHNPMTREQLGAFQRLTGGLAEEKTAANSAAVLAWPETHFDWVRPGLMMYGCSPLLNATGAQHQLQPAMTLESRVIAIKQVQQGESVGYGAHWRAAEDTQIAIVAIGYGDGYPRHARNGTPVWLNGRTVPIAGRVSMDMIAVDLGARSDDQIGDRVVLWGPELPVERVAEYADTIPYTLLCGVTSRVKFHWQT